MTLKSLSAVLATAALAALASPAPAQDKTGANVDPTGVGTRGAVSQLALAQQLYALGLADKDALTVLTAAKLAGSVEIASVERKKETKGDAAAEEADTSDAPVDAATMLASARTLAGEDETLIGLIEVAGAEGSRGRIGGASSTLSRLPAGQSDVWEVPFFGNSLAEVAVLGDGDADLDVLVADENGNAICVETGSSDTVYCDFVPSWNGYFHVTVTNTGNRRNSYDLVTN
ncbi:hypothetical protein RNZ50_18875 [Paracoccaceae bacterium Fryx2]|nr:hypothetical protein [Paracoccaceae bacterium Fryx2]